MYFSAFTSEFGRELWKSDGTDDGAELVKNINDEDLEPVFARGASNPYLLTPSAT